MRTKVINKEKDNTIIKMYKDGLSVWTIANKIGWGVYAVRERLKENGVNPNDRTEKLRNSIVEMNKEGVSLQDIANKVNLSVNRIRAILKLSGETVEKQKKQDKAIIPILDELIARYKSGETIANLSKEYNINNQIISKALKNSDITVIKGCESRFKDKESEIVGKYLSGGTLNSLGKEYGLSRQGIANILIKNGVDRRIRGGPKKEISDSTEQQILDLFNRGMHLKEIVKEINMCGDLVRKVLNKHGLNPVDNIKRKFKEARKEREEIIIDWYVNKKMTIMDIANQLKISYMTVIRCLDRNNIEKRRPADWLKKYDKEDVIRAYTIDKMSIEDIAEKLGITVNTTKQCLYANGINMCGYNLLKELEKHTDDIVKSYVIDNIKTREIAAQHGTTQLIISRILKKKGVWRYKISEKEISEETVKDIIKSYVVDENTLIDIAVQYNTKESIVRGILRKNGVRLRRRGKYSKELMKEVLSAYTIDMLTPDEIEEKFGIKKGTIYRYIRDNGESIKKYSKIDRLKDQIIEDYTKNGMSINKLEAKYKIKDMTISKCLKENGIELHNPRKIDKLKDQIIEDYTKNGMGINKLAAKYKLGSSTISKKLKESGIEVINKGRTNTSICLKFKEDIIRDYEIKRLGVKEIAKKYDLSYSTIYRCLKDNNIKLRRTHS